MDFISLAETAWSFHRQLSGEDDDFAKFSGGGESSSSGATFVASASTVDASANMQDEGGPLDNAARPLLSPSAEAELFLLATNFLLCKSTASGFSTIVLSARFRRIGQR